MSKAWKVAILISLTIHVVMWNSIRGPRPELPPDGDGNGKKKGTVAFKAEDIIDKIKAESRVAGDEYCPSWFGGIGVTTGGSNEILTVHKGYPAEAAGIQPGDMVITPSIGAIRGDRGTTIEITVARAGTFHKYTLKRAKICTSDSGG